MDYFTANYQGQPFVLFNNVHLITLLLIALLNLFLLRFRAAPEATRRNLRFGMTAILWANEISWHIWHIYWGQWTLQTMLPLHLCSVLVWVGGIGLVTKNYPIYELLYFMGISGALQALLTPDVGIYGFPHYRYFQTFISHGLILTSAIYMTTVEGLRPTGKSIWRVFAGMNVYMLIVFVINQIIHSNYLFIAHKPETASILDALPAWPYYIFYIEVIGLLSCLILYLPFALRDWRAKI